MTIATNPGSLPATAATHIAIRLRQASTLARLPDATWVPLRCGDADKLIQL
jgi:hypothetical protein